jgi:NTE family protein
MDMKKVGLALSSGAARGIAHVGVLSILEREGIPIDMIAGTSVGAIIGAFYAAGKTSQEIVEAILRIDRRRMYSFFDFTLPSQGIIRGKKVGEWLTSVIGNLTFDDLKTPFACVAADIVTGEKAVISKGSVVDGVMASTSIPILYMPFRFQGRYLVDGGLVDPVPVDVVREMGADLVIAASVAPDMGKKLQEVITNGSVQPNAPNIFSITRRLMKVANSEETITGAASADIVITPAVWGRRLRPGDRRRISELISSGEQAAIRAIPTIKRLLKM